MGRALSDVLVSSSPGLTVEEMCASLRTDVATYASAHRSFVDLVSRKQARLYVVVDNLEDLHVHVESLRTTLSALFRATRDFADTAETRPFSGFHSFALLPVPSSVAVPSWPQKNRRTLPLRLVLW